MRILQVSRHHWMYAVGGTEMYLRDLVTALREGAHDVHFLTFQGLQTEPSGDRQESLHTLPLFGETGPRDFRRRVSDYLDECRPTIAHFHSLKLEESVAADELRRRKIPYLLTYHHPGLSCYRGDLLQWGTTVCDGRVDVLKCGSCRINNRTRLPRGLSYAVAALIGASSPLLGMVLPPGLRTRIDYWASTAERARMLHDFLCHCDVAIACALWSVDVLRRNGVDERRIAFMPQGLPMGFEALPRQQAPHERSTVDVGFVGRICREKGLDLLIGAMLRVPNKNLRLHIIGWDSDSRHPLEPKLRALSQGDPRIRFYGKLTPHQTREQYSRFDFLAVPSTWLETGPLVVWEALSHGVPVLASARIGHPTLLDGGRGLIVDPHTIHRWAEVLTQVAEGKLHLGVQPGTKLRTMRDVADESAALYASIAAGPESLAGRRT